MLIFWVELGCATFTRDEMRKIERMTGLPCPAYRREGDATRHLCGLLLALYGWKAMQSEPLPQIKKNANGKPYYAVPAPIPLHFSVSHSGMLVACAISTSAVGFDLEKVTLFPKHISSRVFFSEEIAYVAQHLDQNRAAYRLWTRKESLLKLQERGVAQLHTLPSLAENGMLCHCVDAHFFQEVELSPGYMATVCCLSEEDCGLTLQVSQRSLKALL